MIYFIYENTGRMQSVKMLNEDILNVFTFDSACLHIVVTTDIIVERT